MPYVPVLHLWLLCIIIAYHSSQRRSKWPMWSGAVHEHAGMQEQVGDGRVCGFSVCKYASVQGQRPYADPHMCCSVPPLLRVAIFKPQKLFI